MQYKNFEIQCSDYCWYIRDSLGNVVGVADSDEEAIDIIDNFETVPRITDWYKRFQIYTSKMKGRCFINDKIASTNIKAIRRMISSFEKEYGVKIENHYEIIDGEDFIIIDTVNND